MSIKNRIKEFVSHLGIETKSFETNCGLSNGFVNNVGHSIREKSLLQILSVYPELNRNWLLTGEGSMILGTKSDVPQQANGLSLGELNYPLEQQDDDSPFIDLHNGQYIMLVPLVEEYAYAGYLAGFSDSEYIGELPRHSFIVDRYHRGRYFAFRVIGESMDNDSNESIPEGSIVSGRDIAKHLWTSRFHIHRFKDYIIVHKEGILIKRIIEHKVEEGIITCHSLNPDKNGYPDFELHLDDCHQILNIVNVTKLR